MIKYITVAGLLTISIYPFSFVKYQWKQKNKLGACGTILITVVSVIFSSVLLLLR